MASGFDRQLFIAGLYRAEGEATHAIRAMSGLDGIDWLLRNGERVARVERALDASDALALTILEQRLKNIDLRAVWPILRKVLSDIALYLGGSAVAGGFVGAGIGFFAAGLGMLPGALIGASLGAQAGSIILSFLGLKTLVTDMAASVPRAVQCYARGFKIAWGPMPNDGRYNGDGQRTLYRADFDYPTPPEFAARDFADGHVILIMSLLAAIVSYLTRGKGNLSTLVADFRNSARLGPKMATWVEHNAEALSNHPLLQGIDKSGKAGKSLPGGSAKRQAVAGTAAAAGLRDGRQLIGLSEGGPGTWQLSPRRYGGEPYQEKISGVTRGVEYDVPYAGAPGGTVRFDGYDAERQVLFEAKDWKGYPPEGTEFWKAGVEKQARYQMQAAGGMPVEWHFSTQSGLNEVQKLFEKQRITDITLVLSSSR